MPIRKVRRAEKIEKRRRTLPVPVDRNTAF
jgi:hypothetical protein